jgi:hypothetical protein
MSDATTGAKALLAAATEAPCTHGSTIGICCAVRINARQHIGELGFTPATLAVAIKLAEALRGEDCVKPSLGEECRLWAASQGQEAMCRRCAALAAWEKPWES